MSQEKLADQLGLTFQQVQKYEKGANRISVSRLIEIAKILEVGTEYFLDGLTEETVEAENLLTDKVAVQLAEAFKGIEDSEMRRAILELAQATARIRTRKEGGT